jgi:hypothetical protein
VCGDASELPFVGGISEKQGSELLIADLPLADHAVERKR